jgi:hypothetical protein
MKSLTLAVALCLLSGLAWAAPTARPVVSLPAVRLLTPDCVADAAKKEDVPLAALMGILAAEGGTEGEAKGNTNGSFDLGPFQINTCNLDTLADQGFSPEAIMRDGCVNARAAASILRREYERTGNIWTAIGAYHSRTPERSNAYIARVKQHLERMGDGQKTDGMLP